MSYSVGALVRARGREWVVLPDSDDDLLVLRPLGGTEDEIAGVLTELESVESAQFSPPTLDDLGDHRSAQMLCDALRLGFRSAAGPFRSFGTLNFEPRPYQLVPLMMSLRLDPVRLLIADDVGTGKTASALLVAAEMLALGRAQRLAVLCPPHLAPQWEEEMRSKFHLEPAVVLPSTAARYERGCQVGETLFDRHDITIVSTEYIKSERRRADFTRTAPELVIVDEAHTCAFDGVSRSGRQLRHELLTGLAADGDRHLLLVTATPHSGNDGAFRSLIRLLGADFADLPDDLSGEANRRHRERIARHMVQRRRADLRNYLEEATSFPERLETEASYHLSEEGHALLDAALAYARETVRDESTDRHRQRMQFWAVLALLRSLVSSPAAAIDTLEKRVSNIDGSSDEDAEDTSRRHVMDLGDEDGEDYDDETGPADIALDAGTSGRSRRLKELARLAKSMEGENDRKLSGLVDMVGQLLAEGCNPIVFCRYIPTVDYVARELRARFPDIGVAGVSGRVPASERPQVVAELEDWDQRVLVASDCLAEGINLQGHFDAVVHYDLAWNPTRHEQREGRVDRLGQPKSEVKVITYFGADNKIDGHVLEVLHRKSKRIRTMLGYSVPIPGKGDAVAEAIMTGLLLKDPDDSDQLVFEGMDTRAQVVLDEWEAAAENERKSRTLFAQRGIDPDEVANELAEVRAALGTTATVQRFVTSALLASGAHVDGEDPIDVDLTHTPLALREAVNAARDPMASMHFGADEADTTGHLTRTHPFVGGLASYVLDTALDPLQEGPAARAGVVRTDAVTVRTTLLVVRYRFDVVLERGARQLLAEDAGVHAYTGSAESPRWLEDDEVEALLHAEPAGNVSREQAREFLGAAIDGLPGLASVLEGMATQSAGRILDSHDRVRSAARVSTAGDRVDALLPTDILGVYVLLPAPKAS